MVSSLLVFVVTTIAFQAGPPRVADGLRPTTPHDQAPQASAAKELTPEMRGDIQMARKMYREAIETYKGAPANSAVIVNKTGIAYQQLQELAMAKKYYERAVKIDPRYAEAINNLGTIYYERKSYRRAVSQYKKALSLMPPNAASILSNLATAYFARKDYKLASEAFEKALELDPNVFEQRSTSGVLAQDRNVEERAKYHYYLARTYAKAGKTELALDYIRKALEEGFKEREKFTKEPEFAALQEDLDFQKLMSTEPKIL
jgi:tetratricopeptide (TPR) repeat protein